MRCSNFLSFYYLVGGYDLDRCLDYDIENGKCTLPEASFSFMKALFAIHPDCELEDIEISANNEDLHLFYEFDYSLIFCFPPKTDLQTIEDYEMQSKKH